VLAGTAAVAVIVTLPALLLSVSAFVHAQVALVTGRVLTPGAESWLYLVSSRVTLHEGAGVIYQGPRMSTTVESLLHPLIIALGVAISACLAWRNRRTATADSLFAATALIFLLRCTLDPGDQPYYQLPLLATLLAWDAVRAERVPFRGLAATAVAYVLFDRLSPSSIGAVPASILYDSATIVGALLLGRCAFAPRRRRRAPEIVVLGRGRSRRPHAA
jgi:hypothetical protein